MLNLLRKFPNTHLKVSGNSLMNVVDGWLRNEWDGLKVGGGGGVCSVHGE